MKLINDCGLADSGVSGDQHQFRSATGNDAVEGGEQSVNLAVPSVQLLGDREAIRGVASARSEVIDPPLGLPLGQAAPKIDLNSHRCLIPLLRRLGEQLHRDRGDRGRHGSHPLTGCGWLFRDVTVHPFHRVGSREWKTPGQHFVKGHSKRVKVAPRIDRTVHSSRLLGCHVGERSSDELGRFGRLSLARELGRNPKSGEPRVAGIVDEDIRRLDILMYEALLMDLAECSCQPNGGAKEASQVERLPLVTFKNPIQGLTARVFE